MDALSIGLSAPWWLLALAVLVFLPRGRGWMARAGALALLVVALAGPTVPRPADAVAVVIDVSDSVGERALRAASDLDLSALERPPQVWQVAGDASQVEAVAAPRQAALPGDRTDLARGLALAAGEGVGRILLISDGHATRGDLRAALPDVPVDVLPVARVENARIARLRVPANAAPGETVRGEVVVETDRAGPVRVLGTVDGEPLPALEREVPAGRSAFTFEIPLPERGPVRVQAELDVDWEQPSADDALRAEVGVADRPPVLVIDDPAMAELLRAQGFDVTEGGSEAVAAPMEASAVVLRASATRFTPGQLERLRRYVDDGGGLMMSGGPDTFGLGGWYRTPVEEALPVDTDLRSDVEIPLVAMVMVLDRSQSMATGNPSKIGLARQGAAEVVELAYERDLLGLVAFSDDAEWVFELRPATARGKLEMLAGIRQLGPRGGTVLGPAYEEALEALEQSEASIKHVIVLSDGKLYDGQGPFASAPVDFAARAREGRQQGITTSSIAIGQAADFERLREIAGAGGGRYYEALDVGTLPRIFADEALTATRSLLREGIGTVHVREHPLLPPSLAPPPPDAYVATQLKPDAEALFVGEEREPLLAVRRQGLGRTAALTTDLNGWAGDLGAWPDLPGVLGTVVRWLQARPDAYVASLREEGGWTTVTVDAVEDGAYADGRDLRARLGGEEVDLRQVGPGRYQGRLPADLQGETVLVSEGAEVVARARRAAPTPELGEQGGAELLREVASRSGGEVVRPEARYAPDLARAPRSVAWLPAALAGLILLGELAWRRLGGRA